MRAVVDEDIEAIEGFFDSHAHLSALAGRGIETRPLLDDLFTKGFAGIIDIGIEANDLASRLDAFGSYSRLWFACGLWPSAETIANRQVHLSELETAIRTAPVEKLVAIGEAGLDRHWNRASAGADLKGERDLFASQAALALELDLALIVHSREAAAETADILAAFPGLRGVIHCWSYGLEELNSFIDMGFYISFAGNLTYKNATMLREALPAVPFDRLLLETDAPYLAPLPYRGKAALPAMVSASYATAAALLGLSIDKLKSLITQNAATLFGLCF